MKSQLTVMGYKFEEQLGLEVIQNEHRLRQNKIGN